VKYSIHAYIQRPMTQSEIDDTNARPYVLEALHGGKSIHQDGSHWAFGTVSEYVKTRAEALAAFHNLRTIPGVTDVELISRNSRRNWVRPGGAS
jgi:hypothetical protein